MYSGRRCARSNRRRSHRRRGRIVTNPSRGLRVITGCNTTRVTGDLRETIKVTYAAAAQRRGGTSCGCGCDDPISAHLYTQADTGSLPTGAVAASLRYGNRTALAELRAGKTVLDLGSGGGIDVLLAARRVGPSGRVYGLDMTDEMLELARENQGQAGVTTVEFLKGFGVRKEWDLGCSR